MKVLIIKSPYATLKLSYYPGHTVDLDNKTAKLLINGGYAVQAEEEAPKAVQDEPKDDSGTEAVEAPKKRRRRKKAE